MTREEFVRAGVIGVGAMGQHHARVYDELPTTELVGVADADDSRAQEIADRYETESCNPSTLVEQVDLATIAVPTTYHYDLATTCIENGVDILVEKPLVATPSKGRELIAAAERAGVTLQVGHIERFNPVVATLQEIVPDLDVISIDAERLGPPPDRRIDDSAVIDLMIHDIDVVRSLVGEPVSGVDAVGNPDGRHASATLQFADGTVGTLTASRVTQRKVRRLTVTARDCYVIADYLDQSVEIHRHSVPEYLSEDGSVRYRHESVVEHPAVDTGEPLKRELAAFVGAAIEGEEPPVTAEQGLRALELAREIDDRAFGDGSEESGRVNADSGAIGE